MKAGDVVVLKSGGPKMTIEGIADDYATCAWFDYSRNSSKGSGKELDYTTEDSTCVLHREPIRVGALILYLEIVVEPAGVIKMGRK